MFENKCKVEVSKYSIDIDDVVRYFVDLVYKVSEGLLGNKHRASLFNNSFLEEIGIADFKKELRLNDDDELDKDQLSLLVSRYFSKCIFDLHKSKINKTDVLFIIKDKKLIFSYGSDGEKKIKSIIRNCFIHAKLYERFVNEIDDERLRICIKSIVLFESDSLYNRSATVENSIKTNTPYIPFVYFNEALIIVEEVESEDIWISEKKLNKYLNITIDNKDAAVLLDAVSKEEIALKFNNFVFPLLSSDYSKYLNQDCIIDYYWYLFKNSYTNVVDQQITDTSLVKEFKEALSDNELNKLLSYLTNNLYLMREIPSKYNLFFEENIRIHGLKIDQLDIFVPNHKADVKTALGIYSNPKIGDNYNLTSWVERVDDSGNGKIKHTVFESSVGKSRDFKVVKTLKPEIGFYFLHKYFEDLLLKVLTDSKIENIGNVEVYAKGESKTFAEFDFLIKKKNKIVFVEAKTKLSADYIRKQIKNIDKFMQKLGPIKGSVEFVLIGAYSDSNCEDYKFFIDQKPKVDYNKKRKGLNTTPYDFYVPLPKYPGMNLRCIAEPEYDKLKKIIESICQE